MRKILYGFICLTTLLSLQGCFWHSSTTTEKVVEPSGPSSTTVVTPQTSTTVSTTP
jgi:hypothetical protein